MQISAPLYRESGISDVPLKIEGLRANDGVSEDLISCRALASLDVRTTAVMIR